MKFDRNFILAMVLSLGVFLVWDYFYEGPRREAERQAREQEQALLAKSEETKQSGNAQGANSGSNSQGDIPSNNNTASAATQSDEEALNAAPRITIESESVTGSINLRGARFDDLHLKGYHETVDQSSPTITLLKPSNDANAYFAEFGFVGNEKTGEVPSAKTIWKLKSGEKLSPETPVTLTWKNPKGIEFNREISLDKDFMFNIKDTVNNGSSETIELSNYGRITRYGEIKTEGIFVLHEGMLGVFGEEGFVEQDYDDIQEEGILKNKPSKDGWIGFTDKYWATALIPSTEFNSRFNHFTNGRPRFQTDFTEKLPSIAAGSTASIENRFFAGAKEVDIINRYADSGIDRFDLMIDWGWFHFLTKPMFWLLDLIFKFVGNFGVAILGVTVILKIVFFPLANKSYASMARMKIFQPRMTELKEQYGDDRAGLQKAMMELYKKEKINPASGCWPMLVQAPVFFALYKVIYITIEMRHAPFFGWIQDLSAPDPTTIFNLFGLIPIDMPAFLMIGVWPLLMGITMFLQMRMNPTPPDPTQQMIFTWMPIVFTFMMAGFPAGLVIYWAWNNFLSILQQGVIMKKHGAKIELWDNLRALFKKKTADEASSE